MSSSSTAMVDHCPACNCDELIVFYEQENIPVHCCLLVPTRQEALESPCGDLSLAVCTKCGFITNTRFHSRLLAYAPEYEDQQSFSPTFNEFAQSLAERMIQHYDLNQKSIMEIGCGKGDFLKLMCELGNNRGVGIDPTVVPERIQPGTDAKIQWVPEYFGRRHAEYPVDFICCRHSLEHISNVAEFLVLLREVIGDRPIPVMFEVPDTIRVLEDCAFEDIYYEHCSYFTPGSLARLFRRCGFHVTDLYRAYDDQYLLIEVSTSADKPEPGKLPEDSVADIVVAVEKFRSTIGSKIDHWQSVMDAGQKVALWGSGSKCVSLLSSLDADHDKLRVVDINPYRHGKFIAGSGLEIMPPDCLQAFQPDLVIAMNRIYIEEIGGMLSKMDVSAQLTSL